MRPKEVLVTYKPTVAVLSAALSLLSLCLLASPAARADIGVRLGAETVIADHDANKGTTSIADSFQPSANVMLSYSPFSVLSIDGEVSERFTTNPPAGGSNRLGTTVRLGITLSPPVLPIYVRAALPLHLEPSPFIAGIRVGAGLTLLSLAVAKIFIEGDVDFPLFGGTGTPSAFSQQTFSLGAGVAFSF